MSSLKQRYEGRQLCSLVESLTQEEVESTFGVPASAFDGFVVAESDIVKAVPADLLGIINAASVRLGLVSSGEEALLVDLP